MNTQEPTLNVEKSEYIAPIAEVRDIELEQIFLQTTGSGTLPGGGDPGGDL